MTRTTPLQILAILLTALLPAKSQADDSSNHLQMSFGGRVSVPTCRVVIPEKNVVMPSVLIADFDSLNQGDLFAQKEFSVSVADCKGGEAVFSQVVLYFEQKNNLYDERFPAFKNEVVDIINPHALGLGAIITDARDNQNVIGSDFKPLPVIYDTATYPLGTEYHFIAHYMKTSATVTSGYFASSVIITATYQ